MVNMCLAGTAVDVAVIDMPVLEVDAQALIIALPHS
jgi:hypothetical protein